MPGKKLYYTGVNTFILVPNIPSWARMRLWRRCQEVTAKFSKAGYNQYIPKFPASMEEAIKDMKVALASYDAIFFIAKRYRD